MEDTLVTLTESQIIKDHFAKLGLGMVAGTVIGVGIDKLYDYGMKAYRLKKAAANAQ